MNPPSPRSSSTAFSKWPLVKLERYRRGGIYAQVFHSELYFAFFPYRFAAHCFCCSSYFTPELGHHGYPPEGSRSPSQTVGINHQRRSAKSRRHQRSNSPQSFCCGQKVRLSP